MDVPRFSALVGLLVLMVLPVRAQQPTRYDHPLSERRVSYTIDARLEPETRTVHGKAHITWRNPDRVPVDELQFHLYLNAFRDAHSTFMQESGGRHRGYAPTDTNRWGGIDVTRLALVPAAGRTGTDGTVALTDRIRFIQPDDHNRLDRTVASVKLPRAVAPGETVALEVDFVAHMPQIFARTGWKKRPDGTLFFMVAQWFPKLGVYEIPGQRYVPADAPRGRWNTHQFHANSEFYADYGVYEVRITTPEAYRVGASGVLVDSRSQGGRRTVTYRAEDVHDFAWTASPAFLEFTDRWRHVDLRLLLQPEHRDQAGRHFEAAKVALEYFDEWVGEYPYTTLTLVDGLGGANGMEYPTLITCGTFYKMPSWFRPLEMVTIHEFGHQYFYGLLGSNEFEESWLDEGINSYVESRIMDTAYGPASMLDLPGLRIGDGAYQRLAYTKNDPSRGALFTRSWEYDFGDYGKASYAKPATVLHTLDRYLGWPMMREVLQTYYARWRFRHPTTRDFIAVAEEVSGQSLGWFFDQYVYGTAVVDYAVARLSSREAAGGTEETPRYRSEVWLERRADGTFPQTLRVRFEDGHTEILRWDGQEAWKKFTFERPSRLVEAYLDPENRVWLDVNRLNNRRATDAGHPLARKEQLKVTVWLQQLLQLLSFLA